MAVNLEKRSSSAPVKTGGKGETRARTKVCFEFQREGSCSKGADCAYEHVSLPDGKKQQEKRKPNATASPAIFLFEKPEASYVAATEDMKRSVTFQEVKITRGTKHQYEKDVKIRTSQPRPADPATGRIHARMALLKARILRSNIRNKPSDKERTFVREDWEGVDCQVHFDNPEDMESQSSE